MIVTWQFILAATGIAVAAYLLGSVNCAIVVSWLFAGDDVRKHGSGNAGMTNMLRTYGKGPAALTALGDFLKAVVAVLLGRVVFWLAGISTPLDPGYIAGLFALLGHLFPVYFGFRGGKGVMTALGVMMMVNPPAFLIIVIIFVPLVFLTRIVSLSSVLGAAAFPFVTWALCRMQEQDALYSTVGSAVIAVLVLVMHRDNIKRLLTGTENRFEKKKK